MSCRHKPAQYSSSGISLGGVVFPLGLRLSPSSLAHDGSETGCPSCVVISLPFILRKLWNPLKRCDVVQGVLGEGVEHRMPAKTDLESRRLAHV